MKQVLVPLTLIIVSAFHSFAIPYRIAVFDFAISPTHPNYDCLGKGFAEMIAVELAKSSNLELVERTVWRNVLEEKDLGPSYLVDVSRQVEVGQLLAAEYLVSGEITVKDAELVISLRMINVDSATVVRDAQIAASISNYDYVAGLAAMSVLRHFNLTVPLSTAAKVEIREVKNEEVLFAFSKAVEHYDREEYTAAEEQLDLALRLDPRNAAVQAYKKKLAGHRLKVPIEATSMRLHSYNPAYLGFQEYAQLFFHMQLTRRLQSKFLDTYGLEYQRDYRDFSLGYAFPIGKRLGIEVNLLGRPEGEEVKGSESDRNHYWIRDLGVGLNLGWTVADRLAIGTGVSVFMEDTTFETPGGIFSLEETRQILTALCLGIILRNPESTVILDVLSGFSFSPQYLLHAQDLRDFIDSPPMVYTMGDSVYRPIAVESTLTVAPPDRWIALIVKQTNCLVFDQSSYSGSINPGLVFWLTEYYSVSGAAELSIHKMGDVFTFGAGGSMEINFKNMWRVWDLDLAASYRPVPIRSIPGEIEYQPVIRLGLVRNLLSIKR